MKKPVTIFMILSFAMLAVACGSSEQAADANTTFTGTNVISSPTTTNPSVLPTNNLSVYNPASTLTPSINQPVPYVDPFSNQGLAQPFGPTNIIPIAPQPFDPSGLASGLGSLFGGGLFNGGGLFGGGGHSCGAGSSCGY